MSFELEVRQQLAQRGIRPAQAPMSNDRIDAIIRSYTVGRENGRDKYIHLMDREWDDGNRHSRNGARVRRVLHETYLACERAIDRREGPSSRFTW